MPVSAEIRRLTARHNTDTAWPKRLDWLEISGLRGWTGQRFEMRYPIMAVVGENGVGKSTIIQAAASVYKSTKGKKFAWRVGRVVRRRVACRSWCSPGHFHWGFLSHCTALHFSLRLVSIAVDTRLACSISSLYRRSLVTVDASPRGQRAG